MILLLLFYYLYQKVRQAYNEINVREGFEDKIDYHTPNLLNEFNSKYDDFYDKEYVDLYDIAYHDFHDIKRDYALIAKHTKVEKDAPILIGGCGVGKVAKHWKESQYKNICGVDLSKHMLKKAESLYPNIEWIRGNLTQRALFPNNTYQLYIIDERTLYMNHQKDMEQILQNANQWLMEGGYLVVPVYDKNELQLASRYYSTTYIDHLGLVHGFTYLDHFSHDCWYVPDLEEDGEEKKSEILTLYFDKFTMKKDGKKRIKSTMYYFLPKSEVYDMILENGFEKVHIEPICTQVVGGYELGIFRKKKSTVSVKELQKKRVDPSFDLDKKKE